MVLGAGEEVREGAGGVVVSGGAEWGICCGGVVVFRYDWKGGTWGSRCGLGDHSRPSLGVWTSGWTWTWIGGWG